MSRICVVSVLAVMMVAVVVYMVAPEARQARRVRDEMSLMATRQEPSVFSAAAAGRVDIPLVRVSAVTEGQAVSRPGQAGPSSKFGGQASSAWRSTPLFRTQFGQYAAEFAIGTPPQKLNLFLDTGSGPMAVSAVGVLSVITHSPIFDPALSSTGSAVPYPSSTPACQNPATSNPHLCGTVVSYGTGGLEGYLYTDRVSVGSLPSVSTTFTLMTKESGAASSTAAQPFSSPNVAGIVGLAFPSLSGLYGNTEVLDVVSEYSRQLQVPNQFSLCLSDAAGVFSVGHSDRSLYDESSLRWSSLASKLGTISQPTGYYTVNMKSFLVGDTVVQPPAGSTAAEVNTWWNGGFSGTIVDSGTSVILIPEQFVQPMLNIIVPICANAGYPECNDPRALPFMPTLKFVVSGESLHDRDDVVLELPPSAYLVCSGGAGTCQPLIMPTNSGAVLGQPLMRLYYTIFDRTNQRVGFATKTQSNCSITSNGNGESLEQTQNGDNGTPSNTGVRLAIVLPLTLVGAALVVVAITLLVIRYRRRRDSEPTGTLPQALLVETEREL